MRDEYPQSKYQSQPTAATNVPREITHVERLLNELERLSSDTANLCGDLATAANRLCGEQPESKSAEKVRAIGPGGSLGEVFAKIESVEGYITSARGHLSRIQRAV